jgi:hypothetical protein
MTLLQSLSRYKKHVVILGILLIYLLSANRIHTQFFLKNGKPSAENISLPTQTDQLIYSVRSLTPISQDGESLYELRGYAFSKVDPEIAHYQIKIVLHSTSQDLIFPTETVIRTDVTQAFPDFKTNLDKSGFRMLLTKFALNNGNYQIGILLEDTQGTNRFYQLTKTYIERDVNRIRFIADN